MRLALTESQQGFADEARSYFAGLMTDEVRTSLADGELEGAAYRDLVRRMGADGWLTPAWPEEYGGRGLSAVEQFIYFDEAQRAAVPVPFLTTNTVGPTLMRFGTEDQRRRFLPLIAAGELHFSIGYSEPEAGTDLASLRTRAVRDGDHYVINGQKMWTSLIHQADYVWLACRTDPEAPKHEGISIIIVPTDAAGFSWTPVDTIGGGFTSQTFYDDVRVPAENLVLGENQGWTLITTQLNEERVALSSSGGVQRRLDEVRCWAQSTKRSDGRRVVDEPWVQQNLARVHSKVAVLRLLNWRQAWAAQEAATDPALASAIKVYGSELYIETYRLLMEVLGAGAVLERGSPGAILAGQLERSMRGTLVLTFGGGANEIQRDIIAIRALGLPRSSRRPTRRTGA